MNAAIAQFGLLVGPEFGYSGISQGRMGRPSGKCRLDFARNSVSDVDPAGLATGWAALPAARYIMWEYRGFATRNANDYISTANGIGVHERMIGARGLDFALRFAKFADQNEVLYNDGHIVVFHLSDEMSRKMSER